MLQVQSAYLFWYWRASRRMPKYIRSHLIKGTDMTAVEMYTSPYCGYCHAAKRLLDNKGVAYAEIDVVASPNLRQKMMSRANGRHTVPQIFIGGKHVGGFDDLYALERSGKLDPLLAG